MKPPGKKGVKSSNAGAKMKGFFGATKKKPEPDTPIVRTAKGNPGAKAASSKARVERLKNIRI